MKRGHLAETCARLAIRGDARRYSVVCDSSRPSRYSWTIFRPSIIYGRGDQFVTMLARMIERTPVVPVIGSGQQRLQQVLVEHVAEAFARAADLPASEKHGYDVGGPDAVTMLRLLDLIGAALDRRRVRKAHVPLGLVRPAARLLHRLPAFPLTPDQLLMLEEDNICDPQPFHASVGLSRMPLAGGVRVLVS